MNVCPVCTYPHSGKDCDNPGCEANPRVTEAQKAKWKAERDKRAVEEAERQRIRDIRERMRKNPIKRARSEFVNARLAAGAGRMNTRRVLAKRNPVSADTLYSYNKFKRKSSATLRAIISGLEGERFLSHADKSDLNAAKRLLRERSKKKTKSKARKPKKSPRKRSRVRSHYRKAKVTRARKNPVWYAYVIRGTFHGKTKAFYWTGSNWVSQKNIAMDFATRELAVTEAGLMRNRWRNDYPNLHIVSVERVTRD